jgi:hypothetical protein
MNKFGNPLGREARRLKGRVAFAFHIVLAFVSLFIIAPPAV